MTIAFDTNVLIYACDATDPVRQGRATELLEQPGEIVLLWQVVVEFIAASRKLADRGMTPRDAWIRLDHFLAAYPLVRPSVVTLRQARTLHLDHQWSWWDALIVAASQEAGVTRIYSEDLPGRDVPGEPKLEIINPFA